MNETAPPPSLRSLASDVHPRPQLARDRWLELDGTWEFAYDDGDHGLDAGWATGAVPLPGRIQVPFPPESPASGIGDTAIHPVLWYRRTVPLRARPGRRWVLHFGAVDYRAAVFVNGHRVAQHAGGHTPFAADITEALATGGDQVVVVRAEDPPSPEQPRGKQSWGEQPAEIWYERTSGIWQPVWLEEVPPTRIESLRWTPRISEGQLRMEVALHGPPGPGLRLRVVLEDGDGTFLDDTYPVTEAAVRRSVACRREHLWSPEHPNLISAHLALLEGDTVLDEVESYAGLRSAAARGGMFELNGSPYHLRMALDQGYWPESHLAAPSPEALRRDVELIKELGFNGVRVHQKIEDPRFLYWCDRLGLLVWAEMPSCFANTPEAVEATAREWLEALRRDHSHPCVVTWVPCNESWGAERIRDLPSHRALPRALCALAGAVDGTRPVVANDGWEYDVGDIIGVHDYATDPAELRARYGTRAALEETLRSVQPNGHPIVLAGARRGGEPVVLSEFGGVALRNGAGEWFGHDVAPDAEALAQKWEELFAAVLSSEALAGFCYTQFADTRQEVNGMVTEHRVPKVDLARIRAMVQRRPGPASGSEGGVNRV